MKPIAFEMESGISERSDSQGRAVLWQVEIQSRAGLSDRLAAKIRSEVRDSGWCDDLSIRAARGFLIQSHSDSTGIRLAVERVLVDSIVETFRFGVCGEVDFDVADADEATVHVLFKPGVTDAEAETVARALSDCGLEIDAVRTYRKYVVAGLRDEQVSELISKFLANDSIETVVRGALQLDRIDIGSDYQFRIQHIDLLNASEARLAAIDRDGQLSLTIEEMQAIQDHFRAIDREPTDIELETLAQTWSEHCSHKTLAGAIEYQDESGTRWFENMLRETIFAATQSIRSELGPHDWCVSVFRDNAGVVRFDEQTNLAFKVETHNRPSALEPYGGANTGIGGVIRDILGTGLGAKPLCNTDVFCFAPPDLPVDELPTGVLHPRRIMSGVVAGVRDYGNRMGIPTVNGAVYFDPRYVGNPLVFCGNVGLLPIEKSFNQPQPDDLIVAMGGRTGRDGIHGATFSSAELSEISDQTSGGAVQIGNAITEKMLQDALLTARDLDLFSAVTDCGAGGFSSAVGEMGQSIGAEVWLEQVPVKYRGLSYTEIWISEAQERMILAVPSRNWTKFQAVCAAESVEATIIGKFLPTGRLTLKYQDQVVGELAMRFLHDGRPEQTRPAIYRSAPPPPLETSIASANPTEILLKILGSYNVASKHWIIRQYDHEVQAASVIKPLVGACNDGPSDAAVLKPRFDSYRGVVIACGMNPRYGDLDPYHMAASAIDEAMRNCVAVGANPSRIAILDNFCWGRTDRPETLGALVRAALGCHDTAIELQSPFISGKDSLHNEFRFTDAQGQSQTIAIPSTLLISAIGQTDDVRRCVTMDLKQAGNAIYLVGKTGPHLGGSHFNGANGFDGGLVPRVDGPLAKLTFAQLHSAIAGSLVRSCHDLSEGGLAVALAEMAFAGDLGAEINVGSIELEATEPIPAGVDDIVRLFSESNSRFLIEVEPQNEEPLRQMLSGIPLTRLGTVTDTQRIVVSSDNQVLIDCEIDVLKQAWRAPLDWT